MDREITNVAIYVRKSREEETDDTLKRQEAVLIDMCKKNSWQYDIYREFGSSQDLDRAELQAMLDKVKLFHYDGIVVADLDRLSRNTGHFGTIKEILINFGCFVQIPGKLYDFTKQEDDLFSDIQSVLAKNEYQTIKKRLVRGTRQSAKDGNWLGKKNPIGYKYNRDTKRLEPSDDAPVIQRMFQEYLNGLSTTDIADKFALEGVSTTVGMIWTPSGVSRLLNNIVYAGHSLYGKTRTHNGKRAVKTAVEDQILIKNTHAPIIEPEMWDRVQQLKKERNSRPIALQLGKHKYSGLIKCRLCGAIHSFQTSKQGKKRITSCQTRHYKENSFADYTMCKNKGAEVVAFEILFIDRLSKRVAELEKFIDLIKSINKPKKDDSSEKIKMLDKQLKKNQQEIKRVQQGFVMEIFTEAEAQQQIKGLKTQKESIEKEIEQLKENKDTSSIDFLENTLNNLKKFLTGHDNMPETEANEFLRKYVKAIIYIKTDDKKFPIDINVIWADILNV